MNYKKKTTWMLALSLILTILLVGSSITLGAANIDNGIQNDIATQSPATTGIPAAAADSPQPSVSVEDFNDLVVRGYTGQPYSLLKVTLEDGSYLEKKYKGGWFSQVTTGDLNNDGKKDIVLYLRIAGSSGYGNGEAHVLHITENELVEYPNNFIQNPTIDMECPESYAPTNTGTFRVLIGASVINVDGHDLLRIKHQFVDSRETNAIRYTDASFNGSGWWIKDAGMISGEQHQAIEKSQAISNELPAIHRDDFQNAELTFIFDSVNPASDKRDPDKQYYYDDQSQILMLTLRESAQAALQQLYDMTGYQVKKCYVLSTGDILFFSMDKDDFNFGSFFSYFINPILISADGVYYPWQLTISYSNEGVNSSIDAAKIAKPQNLSNMSNEEIAKWYYENSTFGNRRKVVSTEPDHVGAIRLYLANGDFYEATLNNSRVIQNLTGPYKKGFEH